MKTKILSLWVLLFINVFIFPTQYFSQMESEIDPKNMCFPTSMINSALSVGHSFDKSELDKYDNFIHSTIVTKCVNRYAPRYIKRMVNSGEYDKRELWQIEELAFNSYMGKKVCELKTNKLLEEINDELSLGRSLVISGEICNRNHCLSVIDIDENGDYILIDPYGDPTIWYKDNTKYAKISVTKTEFKNMFRMENGKYTYITFYTKDELETRPLLNFVELNEMFFTVSILSDLNYLYCLSDKYNLQYYNYFYSETTGNNIVLSYNSYKSVYSYCTPYFTHDDIKKCMYKSSNLNVDIKTMLSIFKCEQLKGIEFTDNNIIDAYVSSSNLYECLAILCTGYKEYLLSYIPEEVDLLLDKVNTVIDSIQCDFDKVKYVDKTMIFNFKAFYDLAMLSKNESNAGDNMMISCIACLDNRRRLFKQEKCTKRSTFYTVENFKDFCIIY